MIRERAYLLESGINTEVIILAKVEESLRKLELVKNSRELRETILKYLVGYFNRSLEEGNIISLTIEKYIQEERIYNDNYEIQRFKDEIIRMTKSYLGESGINWRFFESDTLETDLRNKDTRILLEKLLPLSSKYKIPYEKFRDIVNLYVKSKPLILTIPTIDKYEDDWKNIILKTIEILKNNIELEEAK
ncbi:hypothetical protein [Fusobacterium ulcerans]|mgnify:CR=1 FL=1|uniref:Uncharacterized protein n=1 Tax=Fusobacterium ulcerans 12-1B TaxID=457404 RepID=H1PYQ4_9FUSO|nr:hypothetical protein [Fusobacterium ulcerans]EHO77243.1 hypothetical protein HMPREF0402_03547 [Fusobacterium ulcerans 12-1B]